MSAVREQISKNLNAILDEMNSACQRSGRVKSSVRLVAVTKYAEWPWVQELSSLYQTCGENRPQQLADRQNMLREAGLLLPQLSMGMSGDFIPAIEEGATLVRIGSRIFQGLLPTKPSVT
jgi:uncharacterized pyridoxal phosphate-containing UPF0001 family protein